MTLKPWMRPLIIVIAIAVWLGLASVGGPTVGKLGEVQENDAAAFLPASAESTLAAQAHAEFVPITSIPALFVVDGVTGPQDIATVQAFVDEALVAPIPEDPEGRVVGDVLIGETPVVPAEDGEAALAIFTLDSDSAGETGIEGVAEALRATWAEQDTELNGYLTGPVGLVADLVSAFAGIDGVLLLVALAAVFIILLIVYRSPVLPIFVLMASVFALSAAALVVYQLAKNDVIDLNGQSQGIMSILVVGATTDYALLLVARYREELQRVPSTYRAMANAWRRSLEPIAASAGTVIAGLLCLLLSDLSSNAALGPVGALGILAAFLSALTFLPAILLVAGRRSRALFWPRMPKYDSQAAKAPDTLEAIDAKYGVWGRVARAVSARPRRVWVASALVLAAFAAFLPTFQASGTAETEVFLNEEESVVGGEVLAAHFPAGQTQPIRIIVNEADADAAIAAVTPVEGVESAYLLTESVAQGAPPAASGNEPPLVIDGRVEVVVTTTVASTSAEAPGIVQDVRDAVHPVAEGALVGGAAAETLDTTLTTERDLKVIIPTVLIVIFIVLMLLLRSVTAPAVLIVANLLSFAATLGLAAIFFNWVFDFPGSDPGTPLFAFVFLVALGVDYSIFLMSRVREESLAHGTREGVRRGLAVTGGVITSAGIVLAATFSALGVIPLLFLAQIAFIVGVGVLIDTFIVRTLLVPGLIDDIGRRSWWPWHAKIKD